MPGVLIFRLDAPLAFMNASWMRDALREQFAQADPPPRVVILDLEFSADLDIKSLDVLSGLSHDLREQGSALWLANVHQVVREIARHGGLATEIGESHIYHTIDDALVDARAAGIIASVA